MKIIEKLNWDWLSPDGIMEYDFIPDQEYENYLQRIEDETMENED